MGSKAYADPIVPSYTIADLGLGSISTDANGNGIIIASNGQTYPFPQTFAGTSIMTPANFPVLDPAPDSNNPFAFSEATNVTLYPNGVATANDLVVNGFWNGHGSDWVRHDVYYAQRNPDGSWGPPILIEQGQTVSGPPISGGPYVSAVVNKSGNVLLNMSTLA
jgi:hypothetical protein